MKFQNSALLPCSFGSILASGRRIDILRGQFRRALHFDNHPFGIDNLAFRNIEVVIEVNKMPTDNVSTDNKKDVILKKDGIAALHEMH